MLIFKEHEAISGREEPVHEEHRSPAKPARKPAVIIQWRPAEKCRIGPVRSTRRRNPIGFESIVLPALRVLSISTWENQAMAYVIAEPCIGTKDTACVDACPVDCIHPKKDEPAYETAELLYIDPVECIDCGACVPVCPVSAIFALDDLPEKWNEFTAKNAAYYGR
jgi:NAD-dependent dihydropyrimidine dehydrogenase PreA subunit